MIQAVGVLALRTALRRWNVYMPRALKRSLGARLQIAPLNTVRLGDLRCLQPVSRRIWDSIVVSLFDRYYIARFLAANASLVHRAGRWK